MHIDIDWVTDEFANERFRHEGWEVLIYANGSEMHPINVSTTSNDVEVEVEMHEGEITVYAERHHGGYEGPGPQRVYIPIVVMRAIIEAYDTVQARRERDRVES